MGREDTERRVVSGGESNRGRPSGFPSKLQGRVLITKPLKLGFMFTMPSGVMFTMPSGGRLVASRAPLRTTADVLAIQSYVATFKYHGSAQQVATSVWRQIRPVHNNQCFVTPYMLPGA